MTTTIAQPSIQGRQDTPAPINKHKGNASPALSSRDSWVFFTASVVMIVGLELDAFKHATDPNLETFFTPWHAIMYAGMALCGGVIGFFIRRNLKAGAPSLVAAVPKGFHGAVWGLGFLLVSGAIDTVWHTSFGIEKGLEILLSPSHLGIISGMFLVASAPVSMLWKQASNHRLATPDATMVVVSSGLAITTIHIITAHASMLGELYLGSTRTLPNSDSYRVHGYVFSTVLLLLPMFALRRRFNTGLLGMFAVTLMPATMMLFLNEKPGPLWIPIATAIATTAAIPLATFLSFRLTRIVRNRIAKKVRVETIEHPLTEMVFLGVIVPLLLWSTMFIATPISGKPVFWSVHVWSGVLLMTMIAGGLTAVTTYGVFRGSKHLQTS
jgi:hypothetical protein